jgi:hypothetical protein
MTVTVSPTEKRNTDHVSLSDGVTTVGLVLCNRKGEADPRGYQRRAIPRSAIKLTQGEQEYSDLEPPWTDVAQKDWSGGRGFEVFEDNRAGYYDGLGVDTLGAGRVFMGPAVGYATGVRNWAGRWPTTVFDNTDAAYVNYYCAPNYMLVHGYKQYYAAKFTPSANFTSAHVWLWVKKTDTTADMVVHIYSDNAGSPNASLASVTLTAASLEYSGRWYIKRVPIAQALTGGTAYWVVLDYGAPGTRMTVLGSSYTDTAGGVDKYSTDGAAWTTDGTVVGPDTYMGAFFRVTDAEKPYKAHFAILKNSLFAALEYLDYTDSKVFINGTQGVASAGNVAYLRDANNAAITNDRFNGGRIYIWDGTGAGAHRRITDTLTANSEIQVTTNFDVAPDTTSKYAVVDVDEFIEVTGIGASSRVTDMLSVNGAIYFARGDGVVIRRLRHYWTAGAPGTYFNWADELINTTLLEAVTNGADVKVWAANRSLPAKVRVATGLDCTGVGAVAALTYGAAINVGNMEVKNTSILNAGESFPHLYVFKEDTICEMIQDLPYDLRIAALKSVRDGWNGMVSCVNDVYIFFNLGDRIERYYKGQLDDISPYMPANRRGRPSAMVAYPGRLYVAYDGGATNYSSILCWNSNGWSEVYRAPDTGLRIMNMQVQPIPGAENVDRLWFSCGSDICWMPIVIDPTRFNGSHSTGGYGQLYSHHPYQVLPYGELETGWFHLGLRDLDKLFNAVRAIGSQNTIQSSGSPQTYVWRKLDGGVSLLNTWVYVGAFDLSTPGFEIDLDANHNLTGLRIKFLLAFDNSNSVESTNLNELNAFILEALETIPYRYVTDLTFRVADYDVNLLGTTPKDLTADQALAQIRTWALSAGTVELKAYSNELGGTGRRVKVDPLAAQIIDYIQDDQRARYICQLTLYEVD